MTSTPRNIIPVSPEGDEEMTRGQKVSRPAAEKVTPSQQGRFLGALEKKKEQKKVDKSTTGKEQTAEEVEGPEEPEEGSSVFHLAKTKKDKGEGSFDDSSEEEGGEKGQLLQQKPQTPTEPTMTAQQMAASQALRPRPIESASSKVESVPGKGVAQPSKQGPTPEAVVTQTAKEREAFGEMMKEEKEDLSAKELAAGGALLRPIVTPSLIAKAAETTGPQPSPRLAVLEVIRQAADALATFVSKHEVRTVVTIKQPPIFEGATLTVTEYSSAPRQFNITFANLSPDARRMLESMANQQQLKQALLDRGYTVQNVFIEATTRPIGTPAVGEAQREERPGKEGEQGGQGGGEARGGTGGEAGGAQ